MKGSLPTSMALSRRMFLSHAAASGLAIANASGSKIRAIAFDAFPIFDPRPVFSLVKEFFPEKGAELGNLWRTKQFDYAWLRTLSHRYADFWQVTGDALISAADATQTRLTPEQHARLMDAYLKLRCWPDAPATLRTLKNSGIRLAFVSNFTPEMLKAGIRNSRLDGIFDHTLSTDYVRAYKPDPRAYQMAVDSFRLERSEILFAAFAGWDVAGAKAFGYPTFWVNRQNQPPEQLGFAPDGVGQSLHDLLAFTNASKPVRT